MQHLNAKVPGIVLNFYYNGGIILIVPPLDTGQHFKKTKIQNRHLKQQKRCFEI